MAIRYLLLDAGGTVVFPNQEALAEMAAAYGFNAPPGAFFEALSRVWHRHDTAYRDAGGGVPFTSPGLFQEVFETAGVAPDAAIKCAVEAIARHESVGLWAYTYPWVKPALERLQEAGWPMTVVSNSDGRVFDHLQECGLDRYFEHVFDSHIVGIEKPDPRFFRHALDHIGIGADEALYIGDIFCIDVVGANQTGIGAVHLDPFNLYGDWPGVHIPDVRALADWLEEYQKAPDRYELFPARAMFA